MKITRNLLLALVPALSIFVTSCADTSVIDEMVKNGSVPRAIPVMEDPLNPGEFVAITHESSVPNNSDTQVDTLDQGVLPALAGTPLDQTHDDAIPMITPEKLVADEEMLAKKDLEIIELRKQLETKGEQPDLATQLAQSEADNQKLSIENQKLKESMETASENEAVVENLRKELAQAKRINENNLVTNNPVKGSGQALFFDLHHPETIEGEMSDKFFFVGKINVPDENEQTLGELTSVGTVKFNRSGTLVIRDKTPGKEGVVAEYSLEAEGLVPTENSVIMSIPSDLGPVLGRMKYWGIVFKPKEKLLEGEKIILDISLSGATLKDGNSPWVSQSTSRWTLESRANQLAVTQTAPIAVTPSSNSGKSWQMSSWILLTIIAIVVIGSLVKILLDRHPKGAADPSRKTSRRSRFTPVNAADPSPKTSEDKEPVIQIGTLAPEGTVDPELPNPFTIVISETTQEEDELGELDGPAPAETLMFKRSHIPPRRETPLLDPAKNRSGTMEFAEKKRKSMMEFLDEEAEAKAAAY